MKDAGYVCPIRFLLVQPSDNDDHGAIEARFKRIGALEELNHLRQELKRVRNGPV